MEWKDNTLLDKLQDFMDHQLEAALPSSKAGLERIITRNQKGIEKATNTLKAPAPFEPDIKSGISSDNMCVLHRHMLFTPQIYELAP